MHFSAWHIWVSAKDERVTLQQKSKHHITVPKQQNESEGRLSRSRYSAYEDVCHHPPEWRIRAVMPPSTNTNSTMGRLRDRAGTQYESDRSIARGMLYLASIVVPVTTLQRHETTHET